MKKYIAILFSILLVFSCKDPFEGEEFKAYDETTVSETMAAMPEYSIWMEMLKKADVFNALNLGSQDFTCFVPNNDAVNAYLKENGYKSFEDIAADDLDYLVRYHVLVGAKIYYQDLFLKLPIPSNTGDYLTAGADLQTYVRYIDNGEGKARSNVVNPDIECTNGLLHGIDHVISPIVESVWDVINSGGYSIFAALMKEAGLEDYLDRTYYTFFEGKDYETTVREYKSVLAVTDEVYRQNGINSVQELNARLGGGDPTDELSGINRYANYHILEGLTGFAEITDFMQGYNSKIQYTKLATKGLSVIDEGGQLTVNAHEEGYGFQFVDGRRDIPARNGYIHEIDGLGEVPSFMAHYPVLFEFTDKFAYTVIPFYRSEKTASSSAQTFQFRDEWDDEDISILGIRWMSVPATRAQIWYNSEYIDSGRMLYNDMICCSLGNIGWIEFDIPVLPVGKYGVVCEKMADSKIGGKFNVWWDGFDGQNDGGEINFGNTTTVAAWKDQTNTREEAHVMKFTAASVAGYLGVDKLMFIPKD